MIFEQLHVRYSGCKISSAMFLTEHNQVKKTNAIAFSDESQWPTCSPVSGSHRPPPCARQPIGNLSKITSHSEHPPLDGLQLELPNLCTANVLGRNQSESHRPQLVTLWHQNHGERKKSPKKTVHSA